MNTKHDFVNHPPHYNAGGKVECIRAIESSMTKGEYRAYLKGNIMKYIWRYELKGGLEDIKKANWYLQELLSTFEQHE